MAKKSTKKQEVVDTENHADIADEATAPEESRIEIDADADSVTIEYHDNHKGLTTRTFSQEVHGDDFKAVATSFAEKHGGVVVA